MPYAQVPSAAPSALPAPLHAELCRFFDTELPPIVPDRGPRLGRRRRLRVRRSGAGAFGFAGGRSRRKHGGEVIMPRYSKDTYLTSLINALEWPADFGEERHLGDSE